MIISASATYLPSESIQTVFNVTNNGASAYSFTGAANGLNPTLTLVRGITYTFNVNATGHPFWIKTAQTTGTSNAYNTGVTNNGDDVGVITFTPAVGSPSTLYYICQVHSIMAGTINIVDAILQRGPDVVISGSLFVSDRIVAREVTASISASFIQGDGSGLFNIPRSAFTGDSFRISSGSVTASVSPVYGFRVESAEKGSEISGSVSISGSLTAQNITAVSMSGYEISGSFVGDGSRLTNIFIPPLETTKIASGSVTASALPDKGFIVQSGELGTQLTGSLFISGARGIELTSGSSYSGSGERLFNIPRTALAPDALDTNRILSGSVTASVSPTFGFRVESTEKGSQFTGSLFLSGSVFLRTGSFSGSGRQLFDIPVAAISDLDTSKIFSGSVTASVSPNFGFVVTSVASGSTFSGSLSVSGFTRFQSGVSASVFSGSGAGLTDIPFSALSQELFRIASGSVTASALPDRGFIVESPYSGSRISGSVYISGSVIISAISGALMLGSSSAYFGEGTYLRNIPRNALSEDALISTEIKSGSVTASVSPVFGFKVQSLASGSQFTGSVFVSGSKTILSSSLSVDGTSFFNSGVSASVFSGSGAGLVNIPRSAIVEDAVRLASGSVTASISPNYGFVVNTFSTITGSFIVSSSARIINPQDLNRVFDVTNDGSNAYVFSGAASGSNPTITLVRNTEYTFNVNASGHPFWIKDTAVTGLTQQYNSWVTNNGDDVGTITFLVSGSAPNTLYYICQMHSAMQGIINVVDAVSASAQISLLGDVDMSGSLYVNAISGAVYIDSSSFIYAEGQYLRRIPRSALTEDALISTEIKSGSVTASVAPDYGFNVITPFTGSQVGSRFTGSLDITGSVYIDSGSYIFAEGQYLRRIPRSALTEDALISTEIKSGSVTASVAPDYGFKVITPFTSSIDTDFFSTQIGSQFTGSVDISGSLYLNDVSGGLFIGSSSFIYAEGTYLRRIPRSALTEDALISTEIKSGSVTASVSPDYGFNVITPFTGSEIGSRFTGSVSVSGSLTVTDFFYGDGRYITNVQAAAAPFIASGSATASVASGDKLIVTTAYTGSDVGIEFTGSVSVSGSVYAQFFVGDGSQITNVQAAAAPFIASGSATASVASGKQFVVTTSQTGSAYGSLFTGSVDVSGSVRAFAFIGDGSQITNVAAAAAPRIVSGSVTASVAPNEGFVVTSYDSGSTFYGDVKLYTGSFSGSGANLFDIPASALQDLQLDRIQSGSATTIQRPEILDVSTEITAARYSGDGGGLFNIPANALQDLKLDRIQSGSAQAVISPDKGLDINTSARIHSGSLTVSGSVFVSGGNVILQSGSTYVGDGSGLYNINIANLSFETFILKSGSVTASISPDK